MKIQIITEREILNGDFWNWIAELKRNGVPIIGSELHQKGEFIIESDLGYTKAKTIYKIMEK